VNIKQLINKYLASNDFFFFKREVGNKAYWLLASGAAIALLDSMGISLFIPLIQTLSDQSGIKNTANETFYWFQQFFSTFGVDLTLQNSIIGILFFFLSKAIVSYHIVYFRAKVGIGYITAQRLKLLDLFKKMQYPAYTTSDVGQLQNSLTVEVERVKSAFFFYFSSIQSYAMVVLYLILATIIQPLFTVFVVAAGLITNIFYRFLFRSLKKLSADFSKASNLYNAFLIQFIQNFKYLRSTGTQDQYASKLQDNIQFVEALNLKTGRINALIQSVREPLILLIIVVVTITAYQFLGITLSTILLTLVLFYRAISQLIVAQNGYAKYLELSGSLRNVQSLVESLERQKINVESKEDIKPFHTICLDSVGFYYGEKAAVSQVSIRIEKGEMIAVIGESGSGKTTLINLITGLITPTTGDIRIDDTSLSKLDTLQWQQKIGYVSQETVIFNDSLFNNITFWDADTPESRSRVQEIVRLVCLEDAIQDMPEQLDTQLGIQGLSLSGGQRQRIAIARELYKEASLLIFDEATSSLDSFTEKEIQENIESLKRKCTMLIVAHRLTTIRNCDRIYLMEKGTVVEHGSFDQLMERSKHFQNWVALNMAEA
jgi:subfamily B ATP-binding cassette protein MsbA